MLQALLFLRACPLYSMHPVNHGILQHSQPVLRVLDQIGLHLLDLVTQVLPQVRDSLTDRLRLVHLALDHAGDEDKLVWIGHRLPQPVHRVQHECNLDGFLLIARLVLVL